MSTTAATVTRVSTSRRRPKSRLSRFARRARRANRDFWHSKGTAILIVIAALLMLLATNFVLDLFSVVIPNVMSRR